MAFKDGGTVTKIPVHAPSPDRPAVGGPPAPVKNIGVSTYHGTQPGAGKRPTAPMPGPGGGSKISTPFRQ
jgi:hypothetical protein